MLVICEKPSLLFPHDPSEFVSSAATLTAVVINRIIGNVAAGDANALREYARFLRDHRYGMDGSLVDLSPLKSDVTMLLARNATRTRPAGFVVVMWDGRELEVSEAVWRGIYVEAINGRKAHWSPSVRRYTDDCRTKWQAIRLDGNEYGRLLLEDTNA